MRNFMVLLLAVIFPTVSFGQGNSAHLELAKLAEAIAYIGTNVTPESQKAMSRLIEELGVRNHIAQYDAVGIAKTYLNLAQEIHSSLEVDEKMLRLYPNPSTPTKRVYCPPIQQFMESFERILEATSFHLSSKSQKTLMAFLEDLLGWELNANFYADFDEGFIRTQHLYESARHHFTLQASSCEGFWLQ